MRGAGGTSGGTGQFLLSLVMMGVGFYLLLSAIDVYSSFSFAYQIYSLSLFHAQLGITSGMVMIPFMFGVGMVFYDAKSLLGWMLTVGSMIALVFGVISSIHFSLRTMNAFELIVILVLAVGGVGLFLRSLKES